MSSTNGTPKETIAGQVEATNTKGLKLQGRWLNYSSFGAPVVHPARGQSVEVTVSGDFVTAVKLLDSATSPAAASPVRDTVISRLAILKAAAAFGAFRPDAKSGDVVKIAEKWEAWVNR